MSKCFWGIFILLSINFTVIFAALLQRVSIPLHFCCFLYHQNQCHHYIERDHYSYYFLISPLRLPRLFISIIHINELPELLMVTVASCRRQAFHCDFFALCLWVSCSLVFSPSFNPPVPSLYVFFSCSTFDFWSVNSSIFHSFHVLLSNLFDYFIIHEAIKFWCGFLWRHST